MSNIALALLSLPFGLAVGSFLHVIAARVPRGQSVVTPASRCMACATPLTWRDNIPVASYLMLRGRCRHCGASVLSMVVHRASCWIRKSFPA